MGCRVGALCQFSWKDQRGLEKQKHRQGALPQGASLQPCPHLRQSLLGLVLESPPWFCSTSQEQPSYLGWIRVAVGSAPLLPLCSPASAGRTAPGLCDLPSDGEEHLPCISSQHSLKAGLMLFTSLLQNSSKCPS